MSASMPLSMNHSPIGAPANGARYWFVALAAANRNHRVDGHDAGLHRLVDTFALDDARRDFFHRISLLGFDRPFAVERPAERVHHAAEQPFADRHGEQPARGFDLSALG